MLLYIILKKLSPKRFFQSSMHDWKCEDFKILGRFLCFVDWVFVWIAIDKMWYYPRPFDLFEKYSKLRWGFIKK